MLNHLAIELAYVRAQAKARVQMKLHAINQRDAIHGSELPGCCDMPICAGCGEEIGLSGICEACEERRRVEYDARR